MVNYTCYRCGHTNKIKSRFIKHLNRKFTCQPILKDIPVEEIYNNYFNKNNIKKIDLLLKNEKKLGKVTQNSSKITQKLGKVTQKKTSAKAYFCKFCQKKFKHKSSKCTHEKNRCKIRQKNEEYEDLKNLVNLLNIQLKEQKRQFKETEKKYQKQIDKLLDKTGINIGTQNNINNIQNNIKILAYNKTDLSHLKDKDYMKFLNHHSFCVPHMIKQIHFNPKKPENHNVYISNIKNKYVMTYDGDKWNIKDRDEVIDDMIECNTNILEDKVEDWLETGKEYPEIMKKFNNYLEKKENDVVLNKIKQEIKFILFNNRKMIKEDD